MTRIGVPVLLSWRALVPKITFWAPSSADACRFAGSVSIPAELGPAPLFGPAMRTVAPEEEMEEERRSDGNAVPGSLSVPFRAEFAGFSQDAAPVLPAAVGVPPENVPFGDVPFNVVPEAPKAICANPGFCL